jgi:hypothetical protein
VKDGPAEFRIDLDWDNSAACFVSEYAGVAGQARMEFAQPANEFDEYDNYAQ